MAATANAQIASDITTDTVNILRVGANLRQAVFTELKRLEGELVSQIAQLPETATTFTRARLNALLSQTRGTINNTYALIAANNGKSLAKIAPTVQNQAHQAVNEAVGVKVMSVVSTPETLEKMVNNQIINGKYQNQWWSKQSADLKHRFEIAMRQGMYLGEGVEQLIRRVRGTRAANFNDGIMGVTRAQAEALVRTSVISTANAARILSFEKNQDVIKGIQWRSTLDNRTTEICIALDGKQWRFPDYEPVGHDLPFPGPTAHWNCRSTQTAVLRSWDELEDKKGRPTPPKGKPTIDVAKVFRRNLKARGLTDAQIESAVASKRITMDGVATEPETFNEFLKKQTTEFQNELLGVGKAQMWRTGEITLTQLIDQTHRPLTLNELRQKVQAAEAAPVEWIEHLEGMPHEIEDGKRYGTLGKYTLPDGTIEPERAKLHKQIIDGFFEGKSPPPPSERTAFFMMGGTASGKSSIVNEFAGEEVVHIDADAIKQLLPEYEQSRQAHAKDAAGLVHDESVVLAGQVGERAVAGGYNFIFDGTGANPQKYGAKILAAKDAKGGGYRTELIAADVDVETAIARANARAEKTGRFVAEPVIRAISPLIPPSFAVNNGLVDGFMLFDTRTLPPRLIWSYSPEYGESVYNFALAEKYGYESQG